MIKSVILMYQASLLGLHLPSFSSTPLDTGIGRPRIDRDMLSNAVKVYVDSLPEEMKGVDVENGKVVVNSRTATLVSGFSCPCISCRFSGNLQFAHINANVEGYGGRCPGGDLSVIKADILDYQQFITGAIEIYLCDNDSYQGGNEKALIVVRRLLGVMHLLGDAVSHPSLSS